MSRARYVLVVVPAAAVLAAIGCSLGLDATLIPGTVNGDASTLSDSPNGNGETSTSDAVADHASMSSPDAGECAKDDDCKSTNACVTSAHCDPAQHVCVLDVCNTGMACKAAVCDVSAMTCTVPVSVNFHPGAFAVPSGATGCNGRGCLAAVYPYVFVGTMNGVTAYQVSDPTSNAPPQLPITGIPFVPAHVVSVDRRVYFIGKPIGGGMTVQLNVAWLDVPGNPFLTKLAATSAFVSTAPLTGGAGVFATDKSSLFLVNDDPGKSFPTALIAPPLTDMTTLTPFPSMGVPANVNIVAGSGPRLVTRRWDGLSSLSNFSFETGVATTNAQNGGEQAAGAMGTVWPQDTFAQGPDGSVLWMASAAGPMKDGGGIPTSSARMAWLVASSAANSFDASQHVDVEPYNLGGNATVAGPMAWLDAKTVLVLAADPQNPTKDTSVQVASRDGGTPTILPMKRFVVGARVDQISVAAAANTGFAYVLIPDMIPGDGLIHVFDTNCPN